MKVEARVACHIVCCFLLGLAEALAQDVLRQMPTASALGIALLIMFLIEVSLGEEVQDPSTSEGLLADDPVERFLMSLWDYF